MDFTMEDILLVVGFCVAMSALPIVLQVSFSIRETKWFAWILPIIMFLISLAATYTSFVATLEDGASMWRVLLVFVCFNILTVVFLLVTRICRTVEERRKAKAAHKKVQQAKKAEKDAARETVELR